LLEAQLSDTQWIEELFDVEFQTDLSSGVECALGREDRILHTTIVRNHAFGVRLQRVIVEYASDTSGITLCARRFAPLCEERPNAQAITTQIPETPQPYWQGSEKRVEVRTCIPKPCTVSDFNVSYRITVEFSSRDVDLPQMTPLAFESNMYVRVAP
jgi:hypothetical protein